MSVYSNENFNSNLSWRIQSVLNHFLFQKIAVMVIVKKVNRRVGTAAVLIES